MERLSVPDQEGRRKVHRPLSWKKGSGRPRGMRVSVKIQVGRVGLVSKKKRNRLSVGGKALISREELSKSFGEESKGFRRKLDIR